jgi:hypothetical protein
MKQLSIERERLSPISAYRHSQVIEIPPLSGDIILAGDRCILVAKKATNSLVRHQTFSW